MIRDAPSQAPPPESTNPPLEPPPRIQADATALKAALQPASLDSGSCVGLAGILEPDAAAPDPGARVIRLLQLLGEPQGGVPTAHAPPSMPARARVCGESSAWVSREGCHAAARQLGNLEGCRCGYERRWTAKRRASVLVCAGTPVLASTPCTLALSCTMNHVCSRGPGIWHVCALAQQCAGDFRWGEGPCD